MTATLDLPPDPPASRRRPTIADFVVGTPYSTGYVAAFFGRTRAWAILCCNDGRFPHAFKPAGGRGWLIPGQDVRRMYGEALIESDRLAAAAAIPTAAETRREAEAALKRLQKPQPKTRATR